VSEWTFNINHSSNPFSTVGLRNSSYSLIESIRVWRRLIFSCWDNFWRLFDKEKSIWTREEVFWRWHRFQDTKLQHRNQGEGTGHFWFVWYIFVEAILLFLWHRNQEEFVALILESWHSFLGSFTVLSRTEVQVVVLAWILRENVQQRAKKSRS